KSIRTGRANPSVLENIVVETYGDQTKLRLMELSSIMTDDPVTLTVSPYDPSTLSDIERAILKSPLGLNPQLQGNRIVVRLPPLSQEQRTKLMRVVNDMIEEKKNTIRNHRDEIRRKIKHLIEKKEITEDQKYRMEKDIDEITQTTMTTIQTIRENKEREIVET
ncbi:ribosome recycling factor, partial [Candidatus Roizmanbacteria bacterium]|nr:ribosome recycling factor [Candidatus Roizmanbacteria bacterium]